MSHREIGIYTHVHSNIVHNSQKVEAIQMSINGGMDKQSMIYTCSGILFSLKKEGEGLPWRSSD